MATILDVKNSLKGILHGTTLNKVTNPNDMFRRAANNLLMRVDPPETKRITQITNAIHTDIYDYSCPSDLKGRKVIDIRPQINRERGDYLSHRFPNPFDLNKKNNTFTVEYNSGEKSLRLSKLVNANPLTLHNMNSITANGTWAVGGDATNLTADTLNYIYGSASMNFDFTGSAVSGYIENSDMTAVDLSDEEDIGRIWVRVYIPDTSIVSSVSLRWGSSSSAYWSATETTPHDATALKTGWNIFAFDWNGATETGSPDSENVDYLRVTITLSSATAETDFRVDNITASRGEIWEIAYYSECLFQTSSGTWQTTTSSDDDVVNLDTDGLNLFIYESGMETIQQIQGANSADYLLLRDKLGLDEKNRIIGGLYQKYITAHSSEAVAPIDTYYDLDLYD